MPFQCGEGFEAVHFVSDVAVKGRNEVENRERIRLLKLESVAERRAKKPIRILKR